MKIVALLLARNEAENLPTYLSSIKPVADEIIAISDRSTDNTKEILLAAGAKVYDSVETTQGGWDEFASRQRLLELGRQNGGTHFICLDADEALSGNFLLNAKEKILGLKPGQKIVLHWPFLWQDNFHYVSDKSCEFTGLYKDFIFCDRPDLNFKNSFLHFGKTPGENKAENLVKVQDSAGTVLHFAYADFNAALLRQAWYRCMELIKSPKNYVKINNRYFLPNRGEGFKTKEVPKEWLSGIVLPKFSFQIKDSWRFKVILNWFDSYGVEFFEKLEIWEISELKEEFVKRTGRKPKNSRLHIYLRPLIKVKRIISKLLF